MSPAQSDDLLSGRYRLRTVIGRGGMGVVWLADDELLHRDVAVKETIWPAHLDEPEQAKLRQRALREARTAAGLDHPNIVKVFDVVEDDGRPWMVMQLVPFRSLGDIIHDDGPLSPAQTAQIGLRLLDAIEAAHAAGVLHRDIKPGNVLLGPDDRVVLTDFGLAVADGSPDLTTSGLILGSPAYMAPERALGEQAGPPADLWSLGATLYAAVEGRDAFRRSGAMAVLTAIVTEAPDQPERAGPLWPALSSLLRKNPAERPDAAEAGRALRQVAEITGRENARLPATLTIPLTTAALAGHGDDATSELKPARAAGSGNALVAAPPTAPPEAPPPAVASPAMASPQGPPPDAGRASSGPADSLVPGLQPRPARPRQHPVRSRSVALLRRRPQAAKVTAGVLGVIVVAALAFLVSHSVAARSQLGPSSATSRPPASGSSSAPSAGGRQDSPSPAGTHSGAAASGGSGGSGGAGGSAPGPLTPAVLSAGYVRYTDPSGFSIGKPAGWQVSHSGHLVYIRPPAGGMFLLIDQTTRPRRNALADWRQQAANRVGTYPGYRQIRIQEVAYTEAEQAADWEFTYYLNGVLTHVLNRNVLVNSHQAYALYWSAPQSQWAASYRYFREFAATFRPASAPATGGPGS